MNRGSADGVSMEDASSEEIQAWICSLWDRISGEVGGEGLERMDKMFRVLSGKESVAFTQPEQTPYSFYLSGLYASRFHDTSRFAFVKVLEDNYSRIKEELLHVLRKKKDDGFEPYLGDGIDDDKGVMVGSGDWKVKYLYRNFTRDESNCADFPFTSSILDSLGNSLLRGMVCFSALIPGTYILPHCGPSNMRLTCHLGVTGCQDVYVTVGGEERMYEDGKCIIFDDSYWHEVRHRGAQHRVTLMLDLWHPDLSEKEIRAFTQLMQSALVVMTPDKFFHSLHIYKKPSYVDRFAVK